MFLSYLYEVAQGEVEANLAGAGLNSNHVGQ